ncbi:P-loop containing nucleoside triphosphate hydrolase protein [Morchella snyderi]|nr:P-loop containing nucleoside triphosphate hydrolase protein [Morchella snyderi]
MRKATSAAAAERSPTPEVSEDELASPVKPGPATRRTRSKPLKRPAMLPYKGQSHAAGPAYDSEDDLIVSDLQSPPSRQTRKRRAARLPHGSARGKRRQLEGSDYEDESGSARRKSGRVTKRGMYTEPDMDDDDYFHLEADAAPPQQGRPRILHSKEIFPFIEPKTIFGRKHTQLCETCGTSGPSHARGNLVYCQGCSSAFHIECMGNRTGRAHLVTKTADDDFVMQCKRCINLPRKKDPTAPDTAACQVCREQGAACTPFSSTSAKKKDSAEATPDVAVDVDLLYNPALVLFRCLHCKRAWHTEHTDDDADPRTFTCGDCAAHTLKIQTIRAWRPTGAPPPHTPAAHLDIADYTEDSREYLIKFHGASYFCAEWLPGAWVWGVAQQMRSHFVKKNPLLAWTTELAVPESMFRIDIVYQVRYTSIVPTGRERDVDIARVDEVSEALVKWQGCADGDVVWEEEVVETNEAGRWEDWRKAYEDFVTGHYVHLPKNTAKRREMVRGKSFKTFEKKEQPAFVVGGKLMKYQMDGMNWLYYKWHQGQTSILADEMGLGKTIQIISFLSIMVNDLSLYPFLIVVPHSTVPNWKREIQNWAPSMRVVAYYGSSESRSLSRKYELFHPGTRSLKCHIVVTSYSTPVTDSQYLKGIPWEALIVDEGQRLKNDESLLYKALDGYKIRHKVLMTGTPLQNNPRELFNLLQFLDPAMHARELEEEYDDLDSDKVRRLHELIRPFFLRRTKKEVLAFLPPMAEVISILAQDPVLIKSIFRNPGDKSKAGNLRNVLMQLRKVLGHPFFYSDAIEDRGFDQETLHRNLIEAGSKLELLNIMLPKLKARGHRVLMFSQFLGMLDVMEDFLTGLGMTYQRLDGGTNTQEKQRRIDAFNRPGSTDFAFLLSTRAGGVGINLATADTVIILDPDFNPHQDIQALSRAHRIGQKNKVLVFHLVTRDTAEERIMQIGKRKLSLDHLIIDRMGADGADDDQVDVESVLRFGARALFEDEGALDERRIRYDDEGVERLLDRSAVEETRTHDGAGADANAFSFARVWASDKGALEEGVSGGDGEGDEEPDTGFWDRLLAEREAAARAAEAAAAQELGRGKRRRKVDYSTPEDEFRTAAAGSEMEDDGEFKDEGGEEEDDEGSESDEGAAGVDLGDGLDGLQLQERIARYHEQQQAKMRAALLPALTAPGAPACKACAAHHPRGECPLRRMGVEYCPLCGLAHFGKQPGLCAHMASEQSLAAMLGALRESGEEAGLVKAARAYVQGRKGAVRRRSVGVGVGAGAGAGAEGAEEVVGKGKGKGKGKREGG